MAGAPAGRLGSLSNLVKAGLLGRPSEGREARDFWIADAAASSCYDCDTPFTLLLRRHHCRVCGRIFCARCTQRSLPAALPGGEPQRCCQFCFKQARGTGGTNWQREPAQSAAAALADDARADDSNADEAEPEPAEAAPVSTTWRSGLSASSVLSAAWAGSVVPVQLALGGGGASQASPDASPDAETLRRSSNAGEDRVQALASAIALPFAEPNEDSDDDLAAPSLEETGSPQALAELFNRLEGGVGLVEEGRASGPAEAHPQDDPAAPGADAHPLSSPAAEPATLPAAPSSWAASLELRDASTEAAALAAVEAEVDPTPYRPLAALADRLDSEAGAWAPPPASDARAFAAASQACLVALQEAADVRLREALSLQLRVGAVPNAELWVPILAELARGAARMLVPSASSSGKSMDPRDYLCVKRCPTGERSDSRLVAGVVCRRNVAHRRMATSLAAPRLLLLGGALQYQRVEGRLSSLETLLEQERAHLRVACARLAALRPHVILVEKSCARYAQELLLAHDVALVLNVKPEVLRRLARATGAAVAPGTDHLRETHCGSCASFRVEPAREEHGPACTRTDRSCASPASRPPP